MHNKTGDNKLSFKESEEIPEEATTADEQAKKAPTKEGELKKRVVNNLTDIVVSNNLNFFQPEREIAQTYDHTLSKQNNKVIISGTGTSNAFNGWEQTTFIKLNAEDKTNYANKAITFIESLTKNNTGGGESSDIIAHLSVFGNNAWRGVQKYLANQTTHGEGFAPDSFWITLVDSHIGRDGLKGSSFGSIKATKEFYEQLTRKEETIGKNSLENANHYFVEMQKIGEEFAHHSDNIVVIGGEIASGAFYNANKIIVCNVEGNINDMYRANSGLIIGQNIKGMIDSGANGNQKVLISSQAVRGAGDSLVKVDSRKLEEITNRIVDEFEQLETTGASNYNRAEAKKAFANTTKHIFRAVYSVVEDKLSDPQKTYFEKEMK